jgi:cyclic pyranopterin phosphate synthase
MPDDGVMPVDHDRILTYDEILRIVRVMADRCGLKKIKVTGGEPLARRGCAQLVRELKSTPGIEQVTITTNAVALKDNMEALHSAGIDGINISLDTLNRERFTELARRDRLNNVLEGIDAALSYPDVPVKINCVPISGHDEDIVSIAGLAKDKPIHVRFIEIMPIGYGKSFKLKSQQQIMDVLETSYGALTPIGGTFGNGPAKYYEIEGFTGKIGFISAVTHKFCSECNRVRLTSEGFLKTCLQYETGADLRSVMRSGSSDEELLGAIQDAIMKKPISHGFYEEKVSPEETRGMSQIGG